MVAAAVYSQNTAVVYSENTAVVYSENTAVPRKLGPENNIHSLTKAYQKTLKQTSIHSNKIEHRENTCL